MSDRSNLTLLYKRLLRENLILTFLLFSISINISKKRKPTKNEKKFPFINDIDFNFMYQQKQ